jgi:hypothetical protein
MMSCKQVSTLLSTGEVQASPWSRRLAVRMHLAMCRHCSAFKRWLDVIAAAARSLSRVAERDAPADLEARVIRRVEESAS